ncbi:MAG: hypothetical protein IT289_08915, partial [Oligoflexia bacterium]|nr:hypothetical protein [Oligoflexia bacterium]
MGLKKWIREHQLEVILFGVPFFIFFRGVFGDFVSYDDPLILINNSAVLNFNLKEIFLSRHGGDFLPVTFLSYAVENFIFGLWAPAFHFNNVVLHSVNAVLAFLFLCALTNNNARLSCFWIALLFAIHPLKVESVSWVTQR